MKLFLQNTGKWRLVPNEPAVAILRVDGHATQEGGAPALESRWELILSWTSCQGGWPLNSSRATPRCETDTEKEQPGPVQGDGLGSIHAHKKQEIPYSYLAPQSEH